VDLSASATANAIIGVEYKDIADSNKDSGPSRWYWDHKRLGRRLTIGVSKVMQTFKGLFTVVLVFSVVALPTQIFAAARVVYAIDFTGNGDANPQGWLKDQGFEFKLDADEIDLHFNGQGLVVETRDKKAGLFVKELRLVDASAVRVTWGVDRYPVGADWDNGVQRVPIAVMVWLGDEKIESGSMFVPDSTYFASLFLGEKEKAGKAYKGKYYKKGGRYYCSPCGVPAGETVVAELNLQQVFASEFKKPALPPVTGLGFQINTKDTDGGARAFLKRIEVLAE
jgi:hypothetical protein